MVFNLRRAPLPCLLGDRARAKGGSEHNGTSNRVAHETSPPTAIGMPPSCDRMKSILERIAIDWNHKCRWSNASVEIGYCGFRRFFSAAVGQARTAVRLAAGHGQR